MHSSMKSALAGSFGQGANGQDFKGSAAAANLVVGQVPLVVDITLRGVARTLWGTILRAKKEVPGGFQGLGPLKKNSP